jgi:hypothetical protein
MPSVQGHRAPNRRPERTAGDGNFELMRYFAVTKPPLSLIMRKKIVALYPASSLARRYISNMAASNRFVKSCTPASSVNYRRTRRQIDPERLGLLYFIRPIANPHQPICQRPREFGKSLLAT